VTQVGEKTHVGTPPNTPDGPESDAPKKDEVRHVKVRVSLFFDGTGNNRINTRERLAKSAVYEEYGKDDNSYANDESNVSRLHDHIERGSSGYDYHVALYVEGIGTRDRDSDKTVAGQGLGKGETGVKGKVDKGVKLALAALQKVLPRNVPVEIDRLTLDTFGFSRGAAAARYCIHRALIDEDGGWFRSDWHGLPTALERLGYGVGLFDVKAVGLFDTVSSFGFNHNNDVKDLHLDAIRKAEAVFHLAAANEYRINFSLTNIDSAGGRGQQFYLPGAHSDIGGGYVDKDSEDKMLNEGAATPHLARFLVNGGWYRGQELRYTEQVVTQGHHNYLQRLAFLNRTGISQRYSFIPLRLMADFCTKQALVIKPEFTDRFEPGPRLKKVDAQLKAYVAAGSPSDPGDWEVNDAATKQLRHDYLHISFSDSIGMGVRKRRNPDGSFSPDREVIRG